MKYLLSIIISIFFSKALFANAIDSLKTDKEVEIFINKVYRGADKKPSQRLSVIPTDSLIKDLECSDIARKWNIKTWEKADFNKDGLTDMLVTIRWDHNFDVYAIIDKGDNTFTLLRLSENPFSNCELGRPAFINKQPVLFFYSIKQDQGKRLIDYTERPQIDTLIFKYGNFVELNPKSANYKVKSINFKTSGCFGTCPIFELNILVDGKTSYIAKDYNPKNGYFETTLTGEKLDEIIRLIQYLNIRKLRDNYAVAWTDDQTANLTIEFSDGSTKEIRDYGMRGTFGLYQLYNLLSDLRLNQYWKRL